MRIAAEKRVEGTWATHDVGTLGHVATLAGQSVALAPTDRQRDLSAWVAGLRQTYLRRHAFREELMRAMEILGMSTTE
jgi:hypothetical protein